MMAILGVDLFVTVWITVVIVTEIVVVALGIPAALPDWVAEPAVYIGAAGLASSVYAVVYELITWPATKRARAEALRRHEPAPASAGESMLPGAVGLALMTFAVFLGAAIYRDDAIIVLVSLPLVFVTAPLFTMFTFGYARDQPDIGGFAYRRMPIGLVAFIVLSGVVGAWRTAKLDTVWIWVLAAIGGLLFLGTNVVINVQARKARAQARAQADAKGSETDA